MAVWLRSTTGNCTTILFGAVILITGLSSVSSAPGTTGSEWLINPCSKQPQIRHGRSAAENQLRTFINKIDNTFFKELKVLYPNAAQNKPMKGNCPRINNMLKPIKDAKNSTMATQAFYETMLQFALFIDKLKDIPVKTTAQVNISKRKSVFEETKENLRLVICEFNDTLTKYEDKNYNIQPNKSKVPKINMKCLPKTLDLSGAQMMDVDFFKKLKKFFRQSRRLLKMKRQNKGKKNSNSGKSSDSKSRRRTKN